MQFFLIFYQNYEKQIKNSLKKERLFYDKTPLYLYKELFKP